MTQNKTVYLEKTEYADDKENMQREIETLEVKLAYQEDTIESLNQIVIEQQDKLGHLQKQMSLLIEKVKSEPGSGSGVSDEIEIPPHY